MMTIQTAVEEIVRQTPYLEQELVNGIINSTALARQLKPKIEDKLFKSVQLGAITIAIVRLEKKLKKRQFKLKPFLKLYSDITVRSNLTEFTFDNSSTLICSYKNLLQKLENQKGLFINFTQSVYQSSLIINSQWEKEVNKIFKEEKLIFFINNLSAISLNLSEDTVKIPGVYYSILKTLGWQGLNIIEIVSSFNELTIIIEEQYVDKAFSVLKTDLT